MTITKNDATEKFEVTIGGKLQTFDTEAAASEAVANAANVAAATVWAKAATGGAKYRDEAFGLAVFRFAVNDKIAEAKLKPKELTPEAIRTIVDSVSDDDMRAAVDKAIKLRDAYGQLSGKHQAPMKGGKLPRQVAESASVLVKPSTAAAQADAAKTFIFSVL